MYTVITIKIRPQDVGSSRYSILASKFPELADKFGFFWRVPESDPRISEVRLLVESWGLQWVCAGDALPATNQIRYSRSRVYEDHDFETVELMQIWPEVRVNLELGQNLRAVRSDQRNKKFDFACGNSLVSSKAAPVIVTECVRAALDAADFRGLIFRPLQLWKQVGGSYDDPEFGQLPWGRPGEPWWIVDSVVMLPPVSPPLYFVHGRSGEHVPRGTRPALIQEPGFSDIERHYLRSELAAVAEFDVALEYESGAGEIIVSRRFYDFCKQHNLKCGFKPVRVDEG